MEPILVAHVLQRLLVIDRKANYSPFDTVMAYSDSPENSFYGLEYVDLSGVVFRKLWVMCF